MATRVKMINLKTNIIKNGFYGFSWTYLFFGFWVPLLRGHYKMAGIHFLIGVISYFTLGILQLIIAFSFNKNYTLRLIEEGYEFADSEETNAEARLKIGIQAPLVNQ